MIVNLPDGQALDVEVIRTERKTLAISVFPCGAIEVRSPLEVSDEEVASRVHRRRKWIARQQEFFDQFTPRTTSRQYVSGETHLYLGRQYRLKLIQGPRKPLRLWGGYLEITLPDPTPSEVRKALNLWYRRQAEHQFPIILQEALKGFQLNLSTEVRVEIRSFKKRWGTCHPDGRISLNIDLVRAPRLCIEYVIVHEICHLLVPDHSTKFMRLLNAYQPDWRARKLKLERILS